MTGKKEEFSEEVKLKCLQWSDRHCCLCDKTCGLDIEIAHIDPKGGNGLDNAIPVCYECHANIGRYNKEHPRGNKYRIKELKMRRDEIYEKYTSRLVPPIHYQIFQRIINEKPIPLPRVDFSITNLGNSLLVRAKVKVRVFLGYKDLGLIQSKIPYYSGGIEWNLNPQLTIFGNFQVPIECVDSSEDLKLEVQVTIIDKYDREHEKFPVCYTYVREKKYWYLEPTSFSKLKKPA